MRLPDIVKKWERNIQRTKATWFWQPDLFGPVHIDHQHQFGIGHRLCTKDADKPRLYLSCDRRRATGNQLPIIGCQDSAVICHQLATKGHQLQG